MPYIENQLFGSIKEEQKKVKHIILIHENNPPTHHHVFIKNFEFYFNLVFNVFYQFGHGAISNVADAIISTNTLIATYRAFPNTKIDPFLLLEGLALVHLKTEKPNNNKERERICKNAKEIAQFPLGNSQMTVVP